MFNPLITRIALLRDERLQLRAAAADLEWLRAAVVEPASQQALGAEVLRGSAGNLETIWLDYLAHGGSADFPEFNGYLHGNLVMPPLELRALDQTLWELRNFAADGEPLPEQPAGSLAPALAAVPSSSWRLLAGSALRAATAVVGRAGRQQLARIGAGSPRHHYVGW